MKQGEGLPVAHAFTVCTALVVKSVSLVRAYVAPADTVGARVGTVTMRMYGELGAIWQAPPPSPVVAHWIAPASWAYAAQSVDATHVLTGAGDAGGCVMASQATRKRSADVSDERTQSAPVSPASGNVASARAPAS